MTSPLKSGFAPLILAILLAGCEEGALQSRSGAETAPGGATRTASVTRDVEAPEVFSTSELALWDGRPSLGGVWVAHPDVTDPERVRITNTVNGQTLEGALFRRERDIPGPRIQVSSEAAKELGLLAGQPTELALVAIREKAVEVEVEVESPEIATLDLPAGEDAPQTGIEAALAVDPDLAANPAVVPLDAETGEAMTAAPAKQKGFFGRLRDGLRRSPAPATSAAAIATGADLDSDTAGALPAPEVETAPLDPVASVAAAAIDQAETEAAARPGNAYIQVGLFSTEANAQKAAKSLRDSGIIPNVAQTEVGGKTYWRVTVGPVATTEDRTRLIETVRGLGFRDAYPTSS